MNHTPNTKTIETYRRQMMEMYQRAAPSPIFVDEEENWLDDRYPEPDLFRDKEAITVSLPIPEVKTQTAPPPEAADFLGYLRVFTFTGGGAEPIEDARVIVTKPNETTTAIYANLTTDKDGFTPVIALPSVDPTLTLRPGNAQPYIPYTVRVTANGFQPVEHQNIPVYGNNYVTQPVALIPILPGANTNGTQEFTSGGPAGL